jgi:hypothetical protein
LTPGTIDREAIRNGIVAAKMTSRQIQNFTKHIHWKYNYETRKWEETNYARLDSSRQVRDLWEKTNVGEMIATTVEAEEHPGRVMNLIETNEMIIENPELLKEIQYDEKKPTLFLRVCLDGARGVFPWVMLTFCFLNMVFRVAQPDFNYIWAIWKVSK